MHTIMCHMKAPGAAAWKCVVAATPAAVCISACKSSSASSAWCMLHYYSLLCNKSINLFVRGCVERRNEKLKNPLLEGLQLPDAKNNST
jgi:hypothetical protein